MRKNTVVVLCLICMAIPSWASALDFNWNMNGYALSVMNKKLLAKAVPDECYNGLDANPVNSPLPCTESNSKPKTNEAYVWGLAKSGNMLYFGTAPNVLCLVLSGYLGMTTPMETESYVCQFGSKDFRPPQIYTFDLSINTLVNKTKTDPNVMSDLRLQSTLGLRSAGSIDDIVFLGGPSVIKGINLFAFNAKTGEYLGSTTLTAYNNIRKWLVFNGQLYTSVGKGAGGSVLKWTGSLANPWAFEEVGVLDSSGAELSAYGKNRIAVATWPGQGLAGIFISPVVPAGGLTKDDNAPGKWLKIWKANDYEPSPLVASTYGGGALAYFDGWLYWGTMHVPLVATELHFAKYGEPTSSNQALQVAEATHRAISIFRGRNLEGTNPEIQLLYGEKKLPAYNETTKTFVDTPTGMNPRYGASGFGNTFNNYTWEMKVAAGQLFVGTMDWSFLYDQLAGGAQTGQTSGLLGEVFRHLSAFVPTTQLNGNGADLWRFRSSSDKAVCESFDGLGNYLNYGIRTMVVGDDNNTLYIGTANPMNLEPKGGWELYQLKKPSLFGVTNW